ncbi:MAG TPA: sodium ion-translocating decarboxylase subunit beta [Lentisphaeria bacterium]|nr:sodium ion-translocating decarboxylase subunit beta [Lentisphaeria bacterium]
MNFIEGEKLTPGMNFITLAIEGRSKAEIKTGSTIEVIGTGLLRGAPLVPAETIEKGQLILKGKKIDIYHESLIESTIDNSVKLPPWGNMLKQFWKTTGIYDLYRQSSENFSQTWNLGVGRLLMIIIGLVLLYLAIFKEFEPLLLLPIGFGAIMSNIPLAGIAGPEGILGMVYTVGIQTGVFPLLIFLGVGAMTDFGPLIANPITALLGAAAQFGIFFSLLGSLLLTHVGINFDLCDAASIGIIGGADGPTAIFLTSKLSPKLLGAIAVAAYSYMALVPIIQPPIMKLLTSKSDRKIKMKQLRHVSKIEKICFPLAITLLCAFLLPSAAPLISMLMLGNLMRECGVVDRLSSTAQNALINIVTIFLGLAVGSKLSAENFLNLQTLGILVLGMISFCVGTAAGVLFGQLMKIFSKGKINPLIGAAGVSAVPMSARVVNKLGLEADPHNFLLMHAMGPNVSGVIGSAVAAGVMLSFLS